MQFFKMGFVVGVAHVLVRAYDSVMVWAMIVVCFMFVIRSPCECATYVCITIRVSTCVLVLRSI
jgi:hypothetical protein